MKKKLIEVALPLEAINAASGREKSIRHGHPSTLHLWWARRPLAACRAIIFASVVDDPSEHPERFPTPEEQDAERERLFRLLERLVQWESTTDEKTLAAARAEIARSGVGESLSVLDPFCGGGSIPIEAQRLGLDVIASDLNPIPVLLTKALVEIPPRFSGSPPVNPAAREGRMARTGSERANGLVADVRAYGEWMKRRAETRIGALYPDVEVDGAMARPLAWIWARTIQCPNPACGATMPLVTSFTLSSRTGRQAWIEPIVDTGSRTIDFTVKTAPAAAVPEPTKLGRGARFRCLVCGDVPEERYVKSEGREGRMGAELLAVVAEGNRRRQYVGPKYVEVPTPAPIDTSFLDAPLPDNARWFSPPAFGFDTYEKLFTSRQLAALTTFSNLVTEVRDVVRDDAVRAGVSDDGISLSDGGDGATAYADAVATYLGFAVDRCADYWSTISTWVSGGEFIRNTFARQAIPMTWDFVECNPFSESTGNWTGACDWVCKALEAAPAKGTAVVRQLDATQLSAERPTILVSTDPPYYDNIGYSDLSDFFFVWLRHSLGSVYPDLFSTLLTPKTQELVATPYRFDGSREAARNHFESGLREAFARIRSIQSDEYPLTVYYAFKQAESEGDGVASTGWETMLQGLLSAGFAVTGTWPVRTERGGRTISIGTGALASSIVLVCRIRRSDAPLATRKDFVSQLRTELPAALRQLQHGNVAPVDLAQASIGPGMAIFSRYGKVIEADGSPMTIRAALSLINHVLDELLAEQEGDFDPDTRWAVSWFGQYGMNAGPFGEADVLARAKNTAVQALEHAGVLTRRGDKVRLLERTELPEEWDPVTDGRLTIWEVVQHLIRTLEEQGEPACAALLRRVGSLGEPARELAYRLFATCERKGWAQEALAFNGLVVAWPEITRLAAQPATGSQAEMEL